MYVNGKKCMKFAARGNVEDIKGVNIKGEAFVYEVKLERKLVSIKFYQTLVKLILYSKTIKEFLIIF